MFGIMGKLFGAQLSGAERAQFYIGGMMMKANEIEREIENLLAQPKRAALQQAEGFGVRPVTALEASPIAILLRDILSYVSSDERTVEADTSMTIRCIEAIDLLYRAPATKGQTVVPDSFW